MIINIFFQYIHWTIAHLLSLSKRCVRALPATDPIPSSPYLLRTLQWWLMQAQLCAAEGYLAYPIPPREPPDPDSVDHAWLIRHPLLGRAI
jgi:hypothetical protein